MRFDPRWRRPVLLVSAATFGVLATAAPAYAGGTGLGIDLGFDGGAAVTGANAVVAALVGLSAGGVTFYLRTRNRREDADSNEPPAPEA